MARLSVLVYGVAMVQFNGRSSLRTDARSGACFYIWAIVAAAALAGWSLPTRAVAAAAEINATGDGDNLWIAKPIGERNVLILHRGPDDEPDTLHPGPKFHGRLASQGIASSAGRLWLVYDNHSVQSIRLAPRLTAEFSPYEDRTERQLESGLVLLSLAANAEGPWALVRVEDPRTLRTIDAPPEPAVRDEAPVGAAEPPTAIEILKPPLEESAPPQLDMETVSSRAPPVEKTPEGPDAFAPTDRLLKLGGIGWEKFSLPDDWPHGARARLIMRDPDNRVPVLVSVLPNEAQLRYDHHTGEGWKTTTYQVDGVEALEAAAVGQHLIVAWQVEPSDLTAIHISLLRPDNRNAMGLIRLETPVVRSWTLVNGGGAHPITVLGWDGGRQFSLTRMDLMGQATATAALQLRSNRPWTYGIDKLVLVLVLAAATLIMFAYWRRDPSWNRPDLPQSLALADLARRAVGGLVDLAPAAFIAMIIGDVSATDLVANWPGHGDWIDLGPWFMMVGLYVAHTSLTELFTARSMGKALMGLRITNLTGEPPNLWTVLIRNGMKVFELIAWPLLLMPALGPYRQRLGDMVARTLAVMEVDPEREGGGGE